MIRGVRVFTAVAMLVAAGTVLPSEPGHALRPQFLVVVLGSLFILVTDLVGLLKRPKAKQS